MINPIAYGFATASLLLPTLWEWWNDRKGDFNKTEDVYYRGALMLAVGVFPWLCGVNYLAAVNGSLALFFLLFDYGINFILGRKPWFEYLSKSKVDKVVDEIMNAINWRGVMAIRIIYFGVAVFLYVWL